MDKTKMKQTFQDLDKGDVVSWAGFVALSVLSAGEAGENIRVGNWHQAAFHLALTWVTFRCAGWLSQRIAWKLRLKDEARKTEADETAYPID